MAIRIKNDRFDSGKKFILSVILCNNRLKYYDSYIKEALKNGYIVTSFIDYIENYKDSNSKIMILRHDIDSDVINNLKEMFEVGKKNSVKATYYFRRSTLNKRLINEMIENGFEVGFHYETLGEYCCKSNIINIDVETINQCRNILKAEINEFNKEIGYSVKTLASHGLEYNIKLWVSNNTLLEDQKYKEYGIICEAYDKEIYRGVTSHIMDNNILYNYGFSYSTNPLKCIKNNDKVIVFLSHPEHWKYSKSQRAKMFIKFLLKIYKVGSDRKFKRIAGV